MRIYRNLWIVLFLVTCLSCNRDPVRNNSDDVRLTQVISSQPDLDTLSNEAAVDTEVNDTFFENSDVAHQNLEQEERTNIGNSGTNNTGSNWWKYGAMGSLFLNLVFGWILFKMLDRNLKLEEGKEFHKARSINLQKRLDELKKTRDSNPQRRQNSGTQYQPKNTHPSKVNKPENQLYDEEKPVEVSFSLEKSVSDSVETPAKKPINLYAEKVTEGSYFSNVSEQKNEHKSIFKLTLQDEKEVSAHFEVLDSEFILKMAANSPDTYLYTVCKPENSNQNFSGEIITTQKGIAHKVDGRWMVKEENKAKIKFQ